MKNSIPLVDKEISVAIVPIWAWTASKVWESTHPLPERVSIFRNLVSPNHEIGPHKAAKK